MDISPATSVYILLMSGLHLLASFLNDRSGLGRGFQVHDSHRNSLGGRSGSLKESQTEMDRSCRTAHVTNTNTANPLSAFREHLGNGDHTNRPFLVTECLRKGHTTRALGFVSSVNVQSRDGTKSIIGKG